MLLKYESFPSNPEEVVQPLITLGHSFKGNLQTSSEDQMMERFPIITF